jgi:L-galactose dehydrogenase/L-glyceraldehyde 3-phosphate reductase
MQLRVFGRTGMQLSVLGFGCGAVGGLIRSKRTSAGRQHRLARSKMTLGGRRVVAK